MLTRSLDTAEKILEYTTVAANALRNVATATQIPFLVDNYSRCAGMSVRLIAKLCLVSTGL
jgi:hypothetical protein